ncbi:FecR family protein [Robertkochia solimangrovi]|uniref:FecR family protein n=1 Tax=Robertkochia solimangrovi TaxID=2213046 RepID=UPI00118123C4|nr:FecR domain-containing protein [Robertkochia solimangrovi]TRZ41589.1 iron dicitrate transport regulator FecR [Robertkochia solimangrovi]
MSRTIIIKEVLEHIGETGDISSIEKMNLSEDEKELIKDIVDDQLIEEALQMLKVLDPDDVLKSIRTDLQITEDLRPKWRSYLKYAAILILMLASGLMLLKTSFRSDEILQIEHKAITLEMEDGTIKEIDLQDSQSIADKHGNVIGNQHTNQITYNSSSEYEELVFNTLNVPYGKTFELQLSDGTKVHLNSGSSLRYPVHFLKERNRNVYLDGEGYFEVSKDPEHPFLVNTGNYKVEVLGTQFNVMNYNDELETKVVLVEGSVKFFNPEYSNEVLLSPAMMATANKLTPASKIELTKVNTQLYTAWIDGRFIYRDMPFSQIIKKLERKYNVQIVNNNKDLENQPFSGNLGDESIEDVLSFFNEVHGLNYEIKDNTIHIN